MPLYCDFLTEFDRLRLWRSNGVIFAVPSILAFTKLTREIVSGDSPLFDVLNLFANFFNLTLCVNNNLGNIGVVTL